MRFLVQATVDNARLGLIEGVERLPHFRLESPNVFFYTKGGAVPYLSVDIFQQITKNDTVLNFPVPGMTHFLERMQRFNGNIAQFIGMPKNLTFSSIIDPGSTRIPGYHTKGHVPIWSRSGKENISCKMYMDLMEAFEPDIFHTLCDSDTVVDSSNKRNVKSLERTLEFFEKCLELHKNSEKLKNSKVIGSLVGGYCKEAREKCSAAVGAAPIFGVSVDALHDFSDQVPLIDTDQIKLAVEMSLKHIPPDKLRMCPGSWNPNVILDLISMGIDIFDTTYPCILAENGGAFTFINNEIILQDGGEINSEKCNGDEINHCQDNSVKKNSDMEPVNKKFKPSNPESEIYISLKDTVYFDKFEPISKHCNCITCRNHTKAYIHHLLNVKELLGPTLLTIHNLHHYVKFFETIRKSLKEDKFEILRNSFKKRYHGNSDQQTDGYKERVVQNGLEKIN
ncbi:UNVERIFIED_CONTAM: hypothetical protein PYX00_001692 [Menopon gallinae]|uniref:Queuine tRNA-ribosyltransferase accessory subunit 2 n=1 Tax=Menopon gallinae TaxID=328185 RepID=A0AAW2IDV5_9NEOP